MRPPILDRGLPFMGMDATLKPAVHQYSVARFTRSSAFGRSPSVGVRAFATLTLRDSGGRFAPFSVFANTEYRRANEV